MDINDLNINDMLKTSLKILKEMLSDRKIDTRYLNKITEEEIIKLFEENQIFDFKVNDNLKVIYYMNNKIKIQDIRKNIDSEKDKDSKIIFISKENLTTNNYKSFSELLIKNGWEQLLIEGITDYHDQFIDWQKILTYETWIK